MNKIIEKANEYLQPINFEPHDTGYFVTMNEDDMGNADFCINCIDSEVKEARKYHKEKRQSILTKYKEIEETGWFNGINIKEKHSDTLIKHSRKDELKKYPAKAKFAHQGHDPDFGGGCTSPQTCEGCGEYFFTNFEADKEEVGYLLEEYGDGLKISDSLKWKLDIVFYNYEYLDDEVKKNLLLIAEKIIKNGNSYQ